MDMGYSCRKIASFQAPIKLAQPFPAPELRAKDVMDTRISLIQVSRDMESIAAGPLRSQGFGDAPR